METTEVRTPAKDFSDFAFARSRIKKLIDAWDDIVLETEYNRALRYIDIDTECERLRGRFKMDETYVPARIIDTNIRREQPQYVAYIVQPNRAAIFESPEVSVQGIEVIESQFTKVARYDNWEVPFLRAVDGTQTHGWDFVEVVFDDSRPGGFDIEHVGRENLIFDFDAEDLQNQELIIKREKFTALQLRKEQSFNAAQVQVVIESNPNNESGTKDILYEIYKCFYKLEDGLVYYAYYGGDKSHDWLRPPTPLFLGVRDTDQQPVPIDPEDPNSELDYPEQFEEHYPFYKLAYFVSENRKITSVTGRAKLDEYAQEAASGIQSGLVNSSMRANNVYGSINNQASDSAAPKQTDVVLKHGLVYDKAISFFQSQPPSPAIVQAWQAVIGQNANEQASVNFATQNREDSRKTATEINASTSEAQKLSGVQVLMLSIFMRAVYTCAWRVYRSRVLQGKIPVPDNSLIYFQPKYIIKSSGDVDIVQRQAKQQKQRQDWPVISQTALANEFLKDIIVASYPDEAAKYLAILNAGDPMQLIMALGIALQTVVTDENGQLKPEYQENAQQLMALQQQVQAYAQSRGIQSQSVGPAQGNPASTGASAPVPQQASGGSSY